MKSSLSHNTKQSRIEIEQSSTAVELQVVRDEMPRTGRPLFLNARRFIRICGWIEKDESASVACRRELVSYAGFRNHVTRNPKYQRRLRKAEAIRESWLREYHIANIVRHAPKSVLASLWWMERRFPSEFALRAVNRDLALEEKPVGNEIPKERLEKYGALMLEMAKENEARQARKKGELPGRKPRANKPFRG